MYDELVKALRGCVLSKPCDGCPYYDPNGPTEKCATMNIAAADAIEELSAIREEQKAQIIAMAAEDKPRWIPVTERLPEDLKFVLVVEDGIVFVAHCEHYYGEEETFVEWHDTMYYPVSPTHWMPLPQPPKEE